MEKKELWLALSALGIAATSAVAAPEKAGVASKINPAVEAVEQLAATGSRVLFVGSDIFREELIRTDAAGQAHLLFLDQSSLTVGPNSELVIDQFVYDPKTNSGDLTMSAAKGVLRFVGGALSKTGDVTIKTPIGNLGIRGAVVLIDLEGDDGSVTACILYGNELSGTIPDSGVSKTVRGHEQCIILTPDGRIETSPLPTARLREMLTALQGPESDSPPTGNEVTLPDNYKGWLRQLAAQEKMDRWRDSEEFNADVLNRDIDDLAS